MNSMALQIENLGHSTVQVKVESLEILTDPFLTDRAGGVKRVVPPAKRPHQVSPQLLLISHAHYDHLDLKTLKELPTRPLILTPENCKEVIKRDEVVELHNFEGTDFRGITVYRLPAHHNRGRNLLHPNTGVGGFLIDFKGFTLYFAGDTAFSENLYRSIAERFKVDLALLPIGGFFPMFKRFHQTPEEAVKAFKILKARYLIPVHFGSWHIVPRFVKWERALERLLSCSYVAGVRDRVVVLQTGEKRTFDI